MNPITFDGLTKTKFLDEATEKQVVCFGVGAHFKYIFNNLILPNNLSVKYLVDTSAEKQGKNLYGYDVFSPDRLLAEERDSVLVLITTLSPYEINDTLEQMGIFGAYASALFMEDFMGLTYRYIRLN
ncbi:MAG: hypothetical protein LBG12_11195 [Synergistaceae bacterium]|jgi:FlaA1/EpsC-like NDP-sugar epimerase|nr:hypothetical protein [Synergistaceae bacterium]